MKPTPWITLSEARSLLLRNCLYSEVKNNELHVLAPLDETAKAIVKAWGSMPQTKGAAQ